ncbi:hypothetical protein HUJ04_012200 [Dendroctonus ponderosae]|nr:hypothetical protein HUJ04_012200 [Dendroctonus ponderosae]
MVLRRDTKDLTIGNTHVPEIVKHFILLAFGCTSASGFLVWVCDTIKYFQYRSLNDTEVKPMMTLHVRYPLNRNKYFFETYILSKFVHEVNLDIKYLILADCMVNSIIIAFLIVQVLFVTTSLSSLMFYVAVSCTVLSQIFIISWFANEIEVMSTSISDALFESHWWEQTEKVKRVISIIMMRSRKPLPRIHMENGEDEAPAANDECAAEEQKAVAKNKVQCQT